MPYIIPRLEQLKAISHHLNENYPNDSTGNPVRWNSRDFYKDCWLQCRFFPATKSDELRSIMSGMYFYGNELIASEYYLAPIRSRMHKMTEDGMQVSDRNPVTSEEKLIYITKFYHHIKHIYPDVTERAAPFDTKENCLASLLAVIRHLLSEQAKAISKLLSEPPTPAVFKKELSDSRRTYLSLSSVRYFTNKSRNDTANWVAYINDTCDTLYPTEVNYEGDATYFQSLMVRKSLPVYVLGSIESEYKLRKPNSDYYKIMLKLRNVSEMSDIPVDEREMSLTMLKRHLELIKQNKAVMAQAVNYEIKDFETVATAVEAWIDTALTKIAFERTRPGFAAAKLNAVTTYLATYGVQTVVQGVTRDFVLPSMGGALLDGAAGTVGFAMFGPSGALVASQLSRYARDRFIPAVTTAVFASVLNQIGEAIAGVTTGVLYLPFSLTASGLQALLDLYYSLKPQNDATYDKLAWVQALLSLPETVFPEANKDKLSQLQGMTRSANGN